MRAQRFSRRTTLALPLALAGNSRWSPRRNAATPPPVVTVSVTLQDPNSRPFARRDFGTVGIFDIDWLTEPGFARMLDNLGLAATASTPSG